MTQTTEQERAEFEKAWRERPIYMGGVHQKEVAYIWWMQAARRAPAVPVPQWVVDGVYSALAFAEEDSPQLALGALRKLHERIAAAPQPPEATVNHSLTVEAAPVQLPEPFAYVEHHKAGDNLWFDCPGGKYSGLYTEHQVRQLLAAHGIKEPQ